MTTDAQKLKERVSSALDSQQQSTITLLSSLLAVQDELGYVPEEGIEAVAHFTHSTINDVWGVASFYTNFRFTPPGDHIVELCWGPSCHVQGAMEAIKAVLDTLGLQGEGDTPDGRLSLRFNTCLGACSQGPVMSVDHRLIGRVSPESARQLVLFSPSGEASEPMEGPPPVEN